MKVSIFMNVFNVHVNRIPLSGKIVWLKYVPGTFLTPLWTRQGKQRKNDH